jgi:hypothetical protein
MSAAAAQQWQCATQRLGSRTAKRTAPHRQPPRATGPGASDMVLSLFCSGAEDRNCEMEEKHWYKVRRRII